MLKEYCRFFLKKNYKLYIFLIKIKKILKRFFKPKIIYLIFRKKEPLSDLYGLDRGQAIDRYYIENFLKNNQNLIQGECLEILNNEYTKKYGQNKVIKSDILDIDQNNKKANIHGDLKNLNNILDNIYDCIILTQVLQFIDDYEKAISECRRILKKDGVLLTTVPSISRIDCVAGESGDFWRFTKAGIRYSFLRYFRDNEVEISSLGNCLIGMNFWIGSSQEELSKKELDYHDPNFPCVITVKAIKK